MGPFLVRRGVLRPQALVGRCVCVCVSVSPLVGSSSAGSCAAYPGREFLRLLFPALALSLTLGSGILQGAPAGCRSAVAASCPLR